MLYKAASLPSPTILWKATTVGTAWINEKGKESSKTMISTNSLPFADYCT